MPEEIAAMLLVSLFFVLLLTEILLFFFIRKRQRKQETKKRIRILTLILFLLLWIVTIKYAVFPPVREIPVTGMYQVEASDYWIDEGRPDPYSGEGTVRELQVRKWIPLDANEKLPVIIASHGSCGTIDNNISLYRELASHGYTVLAVCHPGQAARITYRDGRSAGPSMAFLRQMSVLQPQKNPEQAYEIFSEWMDIRITDLNTVMDDYAGSEGETAFIVLGHSLGGSAAYAMARVRDDVIGCIALESPCMYDIKGVKDGEFVFDDSDYGIPLLNVYSDSAYPHLREWGQYRNNVMFLDEKDPDYTNVYYEGTGHMGLCDLSVASPLLSALLSGEFQKEDAYTQLARLNADCIEWLDTIR